MPSFKSNIYKRSFFNNSTILTTSATVMFLFLFLITVLCRILTLIKFATTATKLSFNCKRIQLSQGCEIIMGVLTEGQTLKQSKKLAIKKKHTHNIV